MNINKVKSDGKKQTEGKKQVLKEEVLAEEITELQTIGLLNDVDANKKPSEVLNSIKEVQMDDVSYGEQNILQQKGKGRYRLDDKLLVLLFLEAFQGDHNGKMTPKYELVSRWFGYPSNTIKKWWTDRDKIQKQKSAITDQVMEVVHLRLSSELLRMTETLSKKDYGAMKDHDFVNLFNTLINKIRLMSNLSTNNVEHKHQGGVQLVMPQEN
jgi:hypothetical protein